MLDVLHEQRFVDAAPATVYATLLDEGTYLCSTASMYRILREAGEVRELRVTLCVSVRPVGDRADSSRRTAAPRTVELSRLLMQRPRSDDGQMIKGLVSVFGDQALDLHFLVAGAGFEPATSGL